MVNILYFKPLLQQKEKGYVFCMLLLSEFAGEPGERSEPRLCNRSLVNLPNVANRDFTIVNW